MARRLLSFAVAATAVLVFAVIGLGLWLEEGLVAPEPEHPLQSIGGPFSLTDQRGRTVTNSDLRDRFMLVYFGYTYCPDVCPADLLGMSQAVAVLDDKRVQPIFITIDPKRDTVETMSAYAAHFHPDLLALTGTSTQIATVAKAYGIYVRKTEGTEEGGEYLMDHTGQIYFMGRSGEFLRSFPHGTAPEVMVEAIRSHLQPAA